MAEQAISELESSPKRLIELGPLINATAQSLQIIEPWQTVQSEHPEMQPILHNIRQQAVGYYRALDLSVITAEAGYSFCEDAEQLCDFLVDPQYTVQELQEYIQDMREVARSAHEDAKTMCESFRNVRQGLNQITVGIPGKVAEMEEQEQRAKAGKALAETRRGQFGVAAIALGAGAAATGGAVAAGIAFPPLLLILPIALPIMAMIAGEATEQYDQLAMARETEAMLCSDAMKKLHQATGDLTKLIENVDMFADWWLEMDTMLAGVESKVGKLKADKVTKLRVKTVKNGWTGVKGRYLQYKLKVARLQDFYPSSRMIQNPSRKAIAMHEDEDEDDD